MVGKNILLVIRMSNSEALKKKKKSKQSCCLNKW